jgi:hypothetical protein
VDLSVGIGGNSYAIVGNAAINGSTFSSSFIPVSDSNGTCGSCNCSAGVSGFFAGSSAERAGLGYNVSDGSRGNIIGAAAFKKQ